jgi:hypothetical protein
MLINAVRPARQTEQVESLARAEVATRPSQACGGKVASAMNTANDETLAAAELTGTNMMVDPAPFARSSHR